MEYTFTVTVETDHDESDEYEALSFAEQMRIDSSFKRQIKETLEEANPGELDDVSIDSWKVD